MLILANYTPTFFGFYDNILNYAWYVYSVTLNSRFPLLRILSTTTSMIYERVMELSKKYPQSIMVLVFRIRNKGNGYLKVASSLTCLLFQVN